MKKSITQFNKTNNQINLLPKNGQMEPQCSWRSNKTYGECGWYLNHPKFESSRAHLISKLSLRRPNFIFKLPKKWWQFLKHRSQPGQVILFVALCLDGTHDGLHRRTQIQPEPVKPSGRALVVVGGGFFLFEQEVHEYVFVVKELRHRHRHHLLPPTTTLHGLLAQKGKTHHHHQQELFHWVLRVRVEPEFSGGVRHGFHRDREQRRALPDRETWVLQSKHACLPCFCVFFYHLLHFRPPMVDYLELD
ncbi:hypothetical protein OSB04_015724 [Centaurea solstitialis]|uniref:Uncharacterized protein n=1 Tax=Centaurea solstitialis TaxID=347529 RepID=A0AA38T173_9ASTR|nr:hypothetical protein OSB04_015724 [Centaurea solstitialis]